MSSIENDAVGAAIFVDHEREMDPRGLHLGERSSTGIAGRAYRNSRMILVADNGIDRSMA